MDKGKGPTTMRTIELDQPGRVRRSDRAGLGVATRQVRSSYSNDRVLTFTSVWDGIHNLVMLDSTDSDWSADEVFDRMHREGLAIAERIGGAIARRLPVS